MAVVLDVVALQNLGLGGGQPNVAGTAQVQAQPPQFGNVTADDSGGGFTFTTVLWSQSGEVSTITHSGGIANSGLDIIENASPAEIERLTGAWVKRVFGGAKTAEFQGRVCAVYRRTPDGAAPGSGPIFALVQSEDGNGVTTWLEDLATSFEAVVGR